MNVFKMFPKAVVPAKLYPVERRAVGAELMPPSDVYVIIDSGTAVGMGGVEQEQSSNVLIYGRPEDFKMNAIGAILEIDGIKYRIASFDIAKNQHFGIVEHIEMSGEIL